MMLVRLAVENDGEFCPAPVEWRISFTRNILISSVRKMYCHCGTFLAISLHQCLWYAPSAARMICGYQNRFNIIMRSDRPMCCSRKRYRCIKVYTRYSPRIRPCLMRFIHISCGRIIHPSLHRFIPFTSHFPSYLAFRRYHAKIAARRAKKESCALLCVQVHIWKWIESDEQNVNENAMYHSWCASLAWIDTLETYPNTHIQFPWQRNGPARDHCTNKCEIASKSICV